MHIYLRLTNVSVFRLKIIFYRHTCGYPFVCNQLEILRGECTSYICLFPTRIWCSVVFSIQGYGELCIHIKKLKFNQMNTPRTLADVKKVISRQNSTLV